MKVDPSARIPANTVELPMGNPLFPSTVGEGGEGVCSGVSNENQVFLFVRDHILCR